MAKWTKFPHAEKAYQYSADSLKKNWAALHIGDAEPLPKDAALLEAWRLFHSGDFEGARDAGLALGAAGYAVANTATNIYANYLEKKEPAQIKLFQEVMERAAEHQKAEPKNPSGYYCYAYAAGRYSQRISIMKALAEGYGGKIKSAIETALKLQPKHAHAHLAMGAYHAEIIDKVGSMVGKLTYGASKDSSEKHFKEGVKLAPNLPIGQIEYANGLLLLQGEKGTDNATELYIKASETTAKDAMERLDIELAKSQLE